MINRRFVLASFVGSLLPLLAHADTQVSAPDADRASLQALVDRFVTTFNAKDLKAFGACFATDGEFTNPVGMYVKGRDAIVAFHERLFTPTRLPDTPSFNHAHLTLLSTSIRMLRPDVASVDIRWQQDGAIGPDGAPWGTRKGILSWIAVRDRQSWLIEVWHNMELPKIP
jgi:uncharacterized protein (TIGR02246 family)